MKTEMYISKNQPDMTKLNKFLSRPVHSESIVNPSRKLKKNEVDLSLGIQLDISAKMDKALSIIVDDFKKFMTVCMKTELLDSGFKFVACLDTIKNLPEGACEAFEIEIKKDKCLIKAQDIDGLRRAFVYLEDEMTIRCYPALKLGRKTYYKTARTRISRSPIASYRYGSGWELENDNNSYPDEYLNGLAHCGINAIWVAGTLRNMVKSTIIPEATPDSDWQSLKRLRNLVDRAADFGIKVYLFCIEPSALPAECKAFEKYPEIKGASWHKGNGVYLTSLCTSTALVKRFMEDSIHKLFTAVPQLSGLINIFSGERITNCRTFEPYGDTVISCARCSNKNRGELLTDILNLYNRAIKKVAPHAELIAWSYGLWRKDRDVKEYIMDKMDQEIIWLENFEHNGKKKYFNRLIENTEYSLSYIGPCPEFKNILDRTDSNAKEIYAKIQLGTTYEQSALPYIPVPESVHAKYRFINKKNLPGIFITWLIGGYPDLMLKASDEALRHPILNQNDFLTRLAALHWGEALTEKVVQVWDHFFKAFQKYPIDENTFYYGPITRCPAYQLYLKPQNTSVPRWQYNWGIDRERNKQPFYDVIDERWLGQFNIKEIIELYRAVATEWEKGVEILTHTANETRKSAHFVQLAIAETALVQFESAANVYEFYHLRASWLNTKSTELRNRLINIVNHEIELAKKAKKLLQIDPRLGFNSELIYYTVSEELLDEKIKQASAVCLELSKTNT